MSRRNAPEQVLQRAVAQYLDARLPAAAMWFHPPNGGNLSKAQAGIMKAMGLKPGVPDIVILANGSAYFIELKAPRGYPTPEQREWHQRLRAGHYGIAVARDLETVARLLVEWKITSRACIAA